MTSAQEHQPQGQHPSEEETSTTEATAASGCLSSDTDITESILATVAAGGYRVVGIGGGIYNVYMPHDDASPDEDKYLATLTMTRTPGY